MNDHITISTHQLFSMFPDQEKARAYLESRLWPNGVRCPVCTGPDGSHFVSREPDRITKRPNGFYRCNACKEDFTVRTGTIFERSHVPLHKWLRAIIIRAVEGAWPTSPRLAMEVGINQPTAWSMLSRLKLTGNSVHRKSANTCATAIRALRGKP